MIPATTAAPLKEYSCLDTALYPIYIVAEKVHEVVKSVLSYLIRILVFQLGEINVPGAYYLIRLFQFTQSDPREINPYDPVRLAESKALLELYGGREVVLHPPDNNAEIRCMTMRSQDFYQRVQELGGMSMQIEPENHEPFEAIVCTKDSRLANDLKKFGFPEISYAGRRAFVIPQRPEIDPENPPCIVRCHSPGRSYAMDRKAFIAPHLAAGYDLALFDYRCTAQSRATTPHGMASEGGYYLDGEVVIQHVNQTYPMNRIYVSGFCEGAAIAAHLKAKFHDQGIHFIGENPFCSMRELIFGFPWPIPGMGRIALPALQSPHASITNQVQQDDLDVVAKFQQIQRRSDGKFIVIHTNTDSTTTYGAAQKILDAAARKGPLHEILRFHENPHENAHIVQPLQQGRGPTWRRYIQIVV